MCELDISLLGLFNYMETPPFWGRGVGGLPSVSDASKLG